MTRDLLKRLESGSGADRELDGDLCQRHDNDMWQVAYYKAIWHVGVAHQDHVAEVRKLVPAYTSSIDASLSLMEKLLPGCWYLIGKGKLKSTEPHFGAQIVFGPDETLGEGEHKSSLPRALLIALLRALEPQP